MKKLFVLALFCMSSILVNAQENKYAEKTSEAVANYIVAEMSLSAEQGTFLKKTLFEKYGSNMAKIDGKNLSQDEKQEIYKSSWAEVRKKLLEQFSVEQFSEINKLEQAKLQELKAARKQ